MSVAKPGSPEQAEEYVREHLLGSTTDDDLAALRPNPRDFAALFGDQAAAVEAAYEPMWAQGLPKIDPARTKVRIVGHATAGAIAAGEHQGFAGGFVSIAGRLPEASVWVAFKCTEPSSSTGMRFDGLCHRGHGRWAFFPKLWRILDGLTPPGEESR